PGLIAHWFAKQGVFKTISVLFITSVLVRLILIVVFVGDLLPK
ncbi:MAG: poly-gamma-glutamate biosynthesis protein PgsC, partial [Candidatus Neomarinimicrobiota bacterium]